MSLFIVSMDTTIINVALPSISEDLGAPISGLQWTIDAYVVVLASLLLLSGSTADRVGRRRTFQTGLMIFVGGSLLCSLAPSVGWLVAFRMVQALGGSMLNPVAMSIITNVFTEPRERLPPCERRRAIRPTVRGCTGANPPTKIMRAGLEGAAPADTVGGRAGRGQQDRRGRTT